MSLRLHTDKEPQSKISNLNIIKLLLVSFDDAEATYSNTHQDKIG